MEQKRKKIEVNASSLVDLKAELFRKQELLRQRKLQNDRTSKPITNKKGLPWDKKASKSVENGQNALNAEEAAEKLEEVDTLDQAKKALTEKARVYEKMVSGTYVPEEDGSQLYLVDFQQKAIEMIAEKRRTLPSAGKKAEEEIKKEDGLKDEGNSEPEAKNPEEEWVDYVDSLGRSRRCMKKDLSSLMEMDRQLSGKRATSSNMADGKSELMSSDMKRELERRKWEKEAQAELEGPTGPVHYANVQFSEVREHGVGYFGFAKDEEMRQQQLHALKELRQQTRSQHEKHDQLKEKRKQMLEARLEKVKQRRIVKDTLQDIDLDPMSYEDDQTAKSGSETVADKGFSEPELMVRDDSWRKNAPIREWDKNKKPVFDEENWLEKQRSERIQEFAPPILYEQPRKRPSHNSGNSKVFRKESSSLRKESTAAGEGFSKSDPVALNTGKKVFDGDQKTSSCDNEKMTHHSVAMATDNPSTIPLPTAGGIEKTVSGHFSSWDSEVQLQTSFVDTSLYPHSTAEDVQQSLPSGVGYWPQISSGEILSSTLSRTVNSTNGHDASVLNVNPSSERTAEQNDVPGHCQPKPSVETPSLFGQSTENASIEVDQGKSSEAPQPAHYCRAPMKPQPKGPKYQAVNLHEIPLTLPAPPSVSYVPHYPSQEEVIGLRKAANHEKSELAMIKNWSRQYGQQPRKALPARGNAGQGFPTATREPSSGCSLRPHGLPFASPYIQNKKDSGEEDLAAAMFDPTKPPPNMTPDV